MFGYNLGDYLFVMFCKWDHYTSISYASPQIVYTIEGGKSYSASCEMVKEESDGVFGKYEKAVAAKVVISENPTFEGGGYYRRESQIEVYLRVLQK